MLKNGSIQHENAHSISDFSERRESLLSKQGYIYFQETSNFSPTPFSEGNNSSLAIERLAFFFDKRRGLKTSFGEEYMDFPFLALERITFSVAIRVYRKDVHLTAAISRLYRG